MLITFLRFYIYQDYSIFVNLFHQEQTIVNLCPIFRAFSNIFSNILKPLSRTYLESPRNIVTRISRGSFQHPPFQRYQYEVSNSCQSLKRLILIKQVNVHTLPVDVINSITDNVYCIFEIPNMSFTPKIKGSFEKYLTTLKKTYVIGSFLWSFSLRLTQL